MLRTLLHIHAVPALALVMGCSLAADGVTPGAEERFAAEMWRIYSFEPRNVPQAQLRDKSKQVAEFWAFVKSDRAHIFGCCGGRFRRLLLLDSSTSMGGRRGIIEIVPTEA